MIFSVPKISGKDKQHLGRKPDIIRHLLFSFFQVYFITSFPRKRESRHAIVIPVPPQAGRE